VPSKYSGVYGDNRGGWYFKATLGRDPTSGKRDQVTRRGYARAKGASDARTELLDMGCRQTID